MHLVLKKKKKKIAEIGFLVPSLRQEESGLRGRGGGGIQTCHFESLFDSIGTEELFTNVHEPIETMLYFLFDFIIYQSEQFTMAIRLMFTNLIQMITDIHI